MARALPIRDDIPPPDLRALARRERHGRVCARLLAIANAFDGMSRRQAAPKALILKGPNPERDGLSAWRLRDLCDLVAARFGKRYSETGMLRLVQSLNLSWQKARPIHPGAASDAEQEGSKRSLPGRVAAVAAAHPEAGRVELWFQDEARIGQKGRVTHVWYERGRRPRGVRDQRFGSAYLFGAVCPERDTGCALVLPAASTVAMALFLAELAAMVPARTHAIVLLDRLARHQRPRGAAEPDPGAAAALQPRAERDREGLAVPT